MRASMATTLLLAAFAVCVFGTNLATAARLFVIGGSAPLARKEVDAFELPGTPSQVPPLVAARWKHGAATAAGLVFAIGGLDSTSRTQATVYAYAPSPIDAWFAATSMGKARSEFGACAFENRLIYAVGGKYGTTPLASGEVYDPNTKQWKMIADMTTTRYAHAVGALGGYVYAVGGRDQKSQTLNNVERYDPRANSWAPMRGEMIARRYGFSLAVVGERLYAIGGQDDHNAPLKSVEVYDPNADAWSRAADMPAARYAAGAASSGGLIYVAGGRNTSAVFDSVAIFDTKTNTWTTSTTMRMSIGRDGVGVTVL